MFKLHSKYEPSGDQPKAIKELVDAKTDLERRLNGEQSKEAEHL